MRTRQEFYIIARSGEMVYYINASPTSEDESSSKLLTASYLTGILQFAKSISGEIISNFELGNLDIWLRVSNDYQLYYVYIIGKDIKLKKKKIEKYLNKIIEEFEKRYSKDEIDNWDGNLNAFDDFSPIAKKVLKI